MKEPQNIIRQIENEFAIVGLRNDGIVHVYYKPNTEISVPVQEIMLTAFNEITGGKKHLFIFQADQYVTVNKEARINAISMEAKTPIKATVVYVTNLAHKIVAEFYYKFNKPVQPYKVASEFEDGIKWLLEIDNEIDERNKF